MNRKILFGVIVVFILFTVFYIFTNNTNNTTENKLVPPPMSLKLYINNIYQKDIAKSGESWNSGEYSNGLVGISIGTAQAPYSSLRNEVSIKIKNTDEIKIQIDTNRYDKSKYFFENAILDIYDENKVHIIGLASISETDNSIITNFSNFESGVYYCSLTAEVKDRGTVSYVFKIEVANL